MRRYFVLAALAALTVPLAPSPGQPPYRRDPRASEVDARYDRLIDGWARRYLQRPADYASMNVFWVPMMRSGTAQETIVAGILASAEYYEKAGGDDRRYAARLVSDVTGRAATPREMAYLLDRLRREERSQAAYEYLAIHPEGLQISEPRPEPAYEYRRTYHRDYDHDRWDKRRDDRRDRRDR